MRRGIFFVLVVAACGAHVSSPTAQHARAIPSCPVEAAPAPSHQAEQAKQVIAHRQSESIQSIAFSPDGAFVAMATNGRAVAVWSARDRGLLSTFRVPQILPPFSIEWAAQGRRLVVGQTQSVLVDPSDGKLEKPFLGKYGETTGELVRRLPHHPGLAWIGIGGTAVALFDDAQKLSSELAWPGGSSASGYVKDIEVSSDGKRAVAAAASKGLFSWDLGHVEAEGRVVPIDGDAWKVAVGGDRAWVAVRPKNGAARVDVVSLSEGRVVGSLELSKNTAGDSIGALALAPDGKTLVAGTFHWITAWDTKTGASRWTVPSDAVVVRSGYDFGSIVGAIAFSPTEPIVAVGNARGDAFFLDATSGRTIAQLGAGVRRPSTLSFSSDSRSLLALSGLHATRWSIDGARMLGAHLAPGATTAARDGDDFLVARAPIMMFDRAPSCGFGTNAVYLARWSQADALAASKNALCFPNAFTLFDLSPATQRALVRFTKPGQGPVVSELGVAGLADKKTTMLEGSDNFLFAATLSADAKHAIASDLKEIRLWDASTGQRLASVASAETIGAAVFSPDGTRFAFVTQPLFGGGSIEVHAVPSGELLSRVQLGTALDTLAFSADGHDLYVGSGRGEIGILHDGKLAGTLDGSAGGGVGALAISPDGRLLASAHQDGGVRVWDLHGRALRGTLVDFDDDEWIITTPGGAFTGTAEVASRVGWVFRSPLERFGFEQFASTFRNSAVVEKRLATGEGDIQSDVRRPPDVTLVAPPVHDGTSTRVRVRASSPSRVERVAAFREGRPVGTQAVCKASGEVTFEIPELAGESRLTFVAVDDRGLASLPLSVDVKTEGRAHPDLWVIAVGVSKYPKLGKDMQLDAPDRDARSIVEAFSKQAGPDRPFAAVHPTTLTEKQVTVATVRGALAELARMKPDDLAIVFFAGHGVKLTDNGEMRFLTPEVAFTTASFRANGIGWSEISDELAAAHGRVLVLVDACQSGHMSQDLVAPNGALAATLSKQGRAGALVFAAAKGRQSSLEDGVHGFFTRAVLDSLDDASTDRDGDHMIDVDELIASVTMRVELATDGEQTPWVARREVFGNYHVAAARR